MQYACGEYTEAALGYGMLLSMSRAGCPYDNAACESFMKTLKQEEIYANECRDIEHLRDHLEEFIDRYYNRCRLHSALSYQSPDRFEAQQSVAVAGKVVRAAKVEFF